MEQGSKKGELVILWSLFVFKYLGKSLSSPCIPGLSPGCSLTCLVLPASPYWQLSFCLPVGRWANYYHTQHSKVKYESQVALSGGGVVCSCTVFLPGKHELQCHVHHFTHS